MPLFETAATAIVHTLGIMALSYSLSPDGRLQAIIPRIDAEHDATTIEIKNSNVEPHAALLAFREQDHRGGTWNAQELEAVRGYLYVELDGEQIDLDDGRPEPQRAAVTAPPSISGLPRLKTCCPNAQLRPAFQSPFAGAVAVVNFPRANSTTQTCGANIGRGHDQKNEIPKRVDTRITVKNNGQLIARAAGKELILDGNVELYVANIPRSALAAPASYQHQGPEHYRVYFAMIAPDTNCEFKQCIGTASDSCASAFRTAGHGKVQAKGGQPWEELSIHLDYQCSNTQWP